MRRKGPGGAQIKLLDGVLKAASLVGDVRVYVEIIEVGLDVYVRPPGSRAGRIIDRQAGGIESFAQVVHLRNPGPVLGAQSQGGPPVFVHDGPGDQARVANVTPDHLLKSPRDAASSDG